MAGKQTIAESTLKAAVDSTYANIVDTFSAAQIRFRMYTTQEMHYRYQEL